jgi:hypothetical protein
MIYKKLVMYLASLCLRGYFLAKKGENTKYFY